MFQVNSRLTMFAEWQEYVRNVMRAASQLFQADFNAVFSAVNTADSTLQRISNSR
jgi:hypothetical protein